MRANEFLSESMNHPVIVVDVQPEYAYFSPQNSETCENIIRFVTKQTGPVLMFINAEESGKGGDTKNDIMRYWEQVELEVVGQDWSTIEDYYETNPEPINWDRFTIVDKGYGYLRDWMDHDVDAKAIIKTIRTMYQQKVTDSRELFDGDESQTYEDDMRQLIGHNYVTWMRDSGIAVNWISLAQLKRFSGAYIVGGGRNECLREVELMMNAFNIRYTRIDSLVY